MKLLFLLLVIILGAAMSWLILVVGATIEQHLKKPSSNHTGLIPTAIVAGICIIGLSCLINGYNNKLNSLNNEILELDTELMTSLNHLNELHAELNKLEPNTSNLPELVDILNDIHDENEILISTEIKRDKLFIKRANLSPIDEYVVWR